MALRAFLVTLTISIATLLSGCGSHPGTGHWVASLPNSGNFWVLIIEFDGKAKVLTKTDDKMKMGCYWQATAEDTLMLQCATAEDPETPVDYKFQVTGDIASFSQDGKELAQFRRRM